MRISQDPRGKSGEKRGQIFRRTFYPLATLKCEGAPAFRSQSARDVACLLDFEPAVASWACMPSAIDQKGKPYIPDFLVFPEEGDHYYLDAPDRSRLGPASLRELPDVTNRQLLTMPEEQLRSGFRLGNAKDLMRYASHRTPLGDRLRLLGALDENGSLTVAECLSAFQETKPVPGLASLILHAYVEVDLDERPLGPETIVRRKR